MEDTLRLLVDYMKRMPISPVTYEKIRYAEGVLTQQFYGRTLYGASYTPTGFLVASVSVVHDKATVKVDVPHAEAENLRNSLIAGVTVTLKPQDR